MEQEPNAFPYLERQSQADGQGWGEARGAGNEKEKQLSPKLELTIPGLILSTKASARKEPKLLPEIPPEITCSRVTLHPKSEELRPASKAIGPDSVEASKLHKQSQASQPGPGWE